MGSNAEREQLKRAYPNRKWTEKVNKMSDEQVVAVILRLKQQGKL